MSRRVRYSPKELVRCAGCRRLTLKTSARKVAGAWYGPECAEKAADGERQLQEWVRTMQSKREDLEE